jgi:hypothetical protein
MTKSQKKAAKGSQKSRKPKAQAKSGKPGSSRAVSMSAKKAAPQKSSSKLASKGAKAAAVPAKGKNVAQKAAPAKAAPVKAVPTKALPTKAPPAKQAKSGKGAKAPKAPALITSLLGNGLGRAAATDEAVCREVACEGLATTSGYCRMHYIKNWKKIQRKAIILREGKLNQYIEELVAKYPDKYIEAIRQDLTNDKDFAKVIYDLDLDESIDEFSDVEGENVDSLIDNIKREFEDEGETF